MRRKGDLPQKVCAHCNRPFAWRKKWAKVWEDVRYCSKRCRAAKDRRRPRARTDRDEIEIARATHLLSEAVASPPQTP